MTVPYNVGLDTMQKQLVSDKKFELNIKDLDTKGSIVQDLLIKDEKIIKCYNFVDSIKNKKIKTYFYAVPKDSLKDQYKEEIVHFTPYEMGLFSTILYQAIYKTFPSLNEYVLYFNK